MLENIGEINRQCIAILTKSSILFSHLNILISNLFVFLEYHLWHSYNYLHSYSQVLTGILPSVSRTESNWKEPAVDFSVCDFGGDEIRNMGNFVSYIAICHYIWCRGGVLCFAQGSYPDSLIMDVDEL